MKNIIKNSYLFLLLILIILVFKNLFFGNIFYGGDAPFFYTNALHNLVSDPLVWTERGYAFGGVNLALWLSPIMIIYGALGKFLSLNNDVIIRIIFIIPSVSLSFFGSFLLTRYLKLSKTIQFFSVLVYIFNTYFLLLLDGGQVGVALAYGIFPITLLFLKKFIDNVNKNNFLLALSFSFLLSIIDPRILIICFLAIFIWSLLDKKFTFWLVLMGTLLIFLNFYWIFPLFKLGSGSINSSISSLGLISLINPLLLFSPHWPTNLFGKINYPPFYYVLVPILAFGSFLFKKNKENLTFALILLIFAFLTKGETAPLGINLSFVFRDTSKFFIPVILFSGILIGSTADIIKNNIVKFVIFLYIVFLINPVLFNKMNFLMSRNTPDSSYSIVSQNIQSVNQEFRTLWFTNKNTLSYETYINPAIDASSLVGFSPFARINNSEDPFNFLNNSSYIDWLRVLGVKYIFLNGDSRNINPNQTDVKNWNTISNLIDNSFLGKKLDWKINFSGYEIINTYPKFYAVSNLIAVVGSDNELKGKPFVPTIYFEDGKWDPSTIYEKKPDSLKLYFTDGNKTDLAMSFLQKYFVSPSKNRMSSWSIFDNSEYLKYKYQLLIRDYKFEDFDYGQGIAFSSKKGESVEFSFDVPKNDDYVIAKRISNQDNQKLVWETESKYIKKGTYDLVITNNGDLSILNTIALIPKSDYEKALKLTDQTIDKFGVTTKINNEADIKNIDILNLGTSKFLIKSTNIGYWIILSDNYSSWWNLKRGLNNSKPYPVYSMLNAFYVDPEWSNLKIEFTGQSIFRWGIWTSAVTFLILTIYFLYQKEKSKN